MAGKSHDYCHASFSEKFRFQNVLLSILKAKAVVSKFFHFEARYEKFRFRDGFLRYSVNKTLKL